MYWTNFRPTKRSVFWCLFLLSVLAMLLPARAANYPKHTTQLLTPLQDIARFLTFQARQALPDDLNRTDQDARVAGMERELAARIMQVEQLRNELHQLQMVRDLGVPAALKAHVVAWDIAAERDAAVIERGAELGVSRKDWVVSKLFLDRGSETAPVMGGGEAVIAQEVLLGRVEFVSPYVSRVRLLSDTESPPISVRVVGVRDGESVSMPYDYSLYGAGSGQMIIRRVSYQDIDTDTTPSESPRLRIGDIVVTSPDNGFGFPLPIAVGRIIDISREPEHRLIYNVLVEPMIDKSELRYVHVIPKIPERVAYER